MKICGWTGYGSLDLDSDLLPTVPCGPAKITDLTIYMSAKHYAAHYVPPHLDLRHLQIQVFSILDVAMLFTALSLSDKRTCFSAVLPGNKCYPNGFLIQS